MSETKGCFGWIAATIGWWILWGLCISIGDIYKIDPFFVLFMLIIGVLVIVVISMLAYYSIKDLLYTKHEKRVKHIQKEYHSAFMQFVYSNGIKIDKVAHQVSVDGKQIDMSMKEFELLVYLTDNIGVALSREKILNSVWNYDYFGDSRTIDSHIKKVRKKLGKKGSHIQTVRGLGYKFEL